MLNEIINIVFCSFFLVAVGAPVPHRDPKVPGTGGIVRDRNPSLGMRQEKSNVVSLLTTRYPDRSQPVSQRGLDPPVNQLPPKWGETPVSQGQLHLHTQLPARIQANSVS